MIAAVAVFEDGKEMVLVQKKLGTGELSQNLFFDDFTIDDCIVTLRLDYNDLDANRDPKLDAGIVENGKKVELDRKHWHHTPKAQSNGEWVYEWFFRGRKLRFKVQLTNEKKMEAGARILPATSTDQRSD